MDALVAAGHRLEASWLGPGPDAAPTLVLLHEGLGSVRGWRDFPARLARETHRQERVRLQDERGAFQTPRVVRAQPRHLRTEEVGVHPIRPDRLRDPRQGGSGVIW